MDHITVRDLILQLSALPPEYQDCEVGVNHEYAVLGVETDDHGKEWSTRIDEHLVTFPRYKVNLTVT